MNLDVKLNIINKFNIYILLDMNWFDFLLNGGNLNINC